MNEEHWVYLRQAKEWAVATNRFIDDPELTWYRGAVPYYLSQVVCNMLKNVYDVNDVCPRKKYSYGEYLIEATEYGWLDATDDDVSIAAMFTEYDVYGEAYVYSSERLAHEETIQLAVNCNRIASLLECNGYGAVYIDIPGEGKERNAERNTVAKTQVSAVPSNPRYGTKTPPTPPKYDNVNLPSKTVNRIVDSIIEAVPTDRIYIFGSYARHEETENSDIDIYVVTKTSKQDDDADWLSVVSTVKNALDWLGMEMDVLTLPADKFDEAASSNTGMVRFVARDAVMIYPRGGETK